MLPTLGRTVVVRDSSFNENSLCGLVFGHVGHFVAESVHANNNGITAILYNLGEHLVNHLFGLVRPSLLVHPESLPVPTAAPVPGTDVGFRFPRPAAINTARPCCTATGLGCR